MTKKQRAALLIAAEQIAKKESDVMCGVLEQLDIHLLDIPEAKMICPFEEDAMYMTRSNAWWGRITMELYMDSDECRGARLIGIAMMLTMPKEMLEDTL